MNLIQSATISGHHSCSARNMLITVFDAPWILGVECVSSKLKNCREVPQGKSAIEFGPEKPGRFQDQGSPWTALRPLPPWPLL